MRLLEYQTGRFYKDCIYTGKEKHICAEKGYRLAFWINRRMENWLSNEDCTDEDFIKAVYKENLEKNIIPETELFEILARFLCGYDLYEKNDDLELEDVDAKVTNQALLNKLDYIKNCIC